MLYVFPDCTYVFVDGKHMEGLRRIFLSQPGAADDLQLVDFQDVELCLGDAFGLPYDVGSRLSGQTDDDVSSGDDAPIVGSRNGAPGAFEGVSAVYPLEGGVAGALYPVFHGEECLPVQPLKIVEQLVADAVGARAHHESHDAVAGERLLVASPYRIEVCIRVAVCLEIRQVFHVGVFPREERFAVADLLPDGERAVAVGGVERAVVAERATSAAYAAVAIGAREAGVDGNLLYPEGKPLPYPFAERIIVFHKNEKLYLFKDNAKVINIF